MKVIKWLDDYFEEFFLVIFLVLISCVMMAQVVARYIFNNSMSWPEEFCRYCYVWSVFFSISYTIKKGNMLAVNIVMDQFPQWIRSIVKIFCDIVMLALFVVFFQHSLQVIGNIKNITHEISAAMQIPMWLVYLCTSIAFGLSAIRTAEALYDHIRHFNRKSISTIEATLNDAKAEIDNLSRDEAGAAEGGSK